MSGGVFTMPCHSSGYMCNPKPVWVDWNSGAHPAYDQVAPNCPSSKFTLRTSSSWALKAPQKPSRAKELVSARMEVYPLDDEGT